MTRSPKHHSATRRGWSTMSTMDRCAGPTLVRSDLIHGYLEGTIRTDRTKSCGKDFGHVRGSSCLSYSLTVHLRALVSENSAL